MDKLPNLASLRSAQSGSPSIPTVILVRHGHTALNTSDAQDGSPERVRGWIDVPLTDKGKAQSKEVALKLSSIPIDSIESSDLQRAKFTAESIRDAQPRKPKVVFCKQLRPWDLGNLAGQKVADISRELDAMVKNKDLRPPGGETFHEFEHRFLPYFQKQLDEAKQTRNTRVLVTHTRNVRAAYYWIKDGEKGLTSIKMAGPHDVIETGDALILRYEAGRWVSKIMKHG